VDAFYQAALAEGGKGNGASGLRAQHHTSCYGAFVLDPDGNNLEAVCHTPEWVVERLCTAYPGALIATVLSKPPQAGGG
jgi:hypothetical protein